jgi:hypothetical protein
MAATFTRGYHVATLEIGCGMTYHPVTGDLLAELDYCFQSRRFCYYVSEGPWDQNAEQVLLDPIGDRQHAYYLYGYEYPTHWKYDPWSGEPLPETHPA